MAWLFWVGAAMALIGLVILNWFVALAYVLILLGIIFMAIGDFFG